MMVYYGAHFRMARAALRMTTKEICRYTQMSMTTLGRIEAAGRIEYGPKQRGRFARHTVERLAYLYEHLHCITFLAADKHGPGVSFDQNAWVERWLPAQVRGKDAANRR